MRKNLTRNRRNENEEKIPITYYFTIIFVVIGTFTALYFLNQKVESLSLFIILLSISGGGLPIGFVGAFIDYKVSKYRVDHSRS